MKPHNRLKRQLLINQHEFYSERHRGDDYYRLYPRFDGYYELFKNDEHQPHVLVACDGCKLIAFGVGSNRGYSNIVDIEDVQFLNFDFINESDFDGDESYTVSFNGQEVLLSSMEHSKPDKFHLESNLI
ncbi:hypothetical protein [Flavobacterium filum]|uniref:hypothetical protein n=1 Tax=Flavobacterium filum TaxID=370974 RepID=UPI0023F4CD62|nr:hypothetical protein [Flavobacterium filum]